MKSTTNANVRLRILQITPMENVGGRRRVEAGRICERKNGRGVDTNRNWGVDWGKKAPDYDPSEEFPGTGPLSEPESFLLHQILTSHKPHAWVNVHSGMEALFMPYDHQARLPTGARPPKFPRPTMGTFCVLFFCLFSRFWGLAASFQVNPRACGGYGNLKVSGSRCDRSRLF